MKVKFFHSRRVGELEEAINAFLASQEVSVHLTQFSAIPREDDLQYWIEFTVILFYYPRVEEGDPFEEVVKEPEPEPIVWESQLDREISDVKKEEN